MSLHKEINLEVEICEHLAAHGWLYAESDAGAYDRARALFPSDAIEWARAAHPQAWDTLVKNHGAAATETLLARLRDQLDQRGTLDVLRHGLELLGLRQPLKLAEFKPALAMNPDILARYQANRLRETERPGVGAAAVVPERRVGALRGQQPRSPRGAHRAHARAAVRLIGPCRARRALTRRTRRRRCARRRRRAL